MTRLEIDWPDAGAERARAACGRLEQAGVVLRAIPTSERLAAITGVLEDWTRADSPWRRELAATLVDATPFSAGTIEEGLTSALRAWQPKAFDACARRELAIASDRARLAPFDWTTVLAGGAIPMPTLLTALLPLVLGSPVLLRETRKDPVTAGLIERSIASRDERMAQAFAPFVCDPSDQTALEVILQAPCVVATGSDETMQSIARRLGSGQRFVAYGHRFSIAVLGPALATDDQALSQATTGLALDIARWDQLGCLSPVVVYLVGLEPSARRRIARALDAALARLAESMPRGKLPDAIRVQHANERAEARMRAASGETVLLEGDGHTLVLEEDARPRPAPLHRFLRLHPVDTTDGLLEALRPFDGQLSSVALLGFDDRTDPGGLPLAERLTQIGVSRVASPGTLQTPPIDWPRDGLPLFTPMARFAESISCP